LIQGVVAQQVVPPLVVVALLFAAGLIVSHRRPRGAVLGIGVLAALALAAFLPDRVRDLSQPESAVSFVITGAVAVASVVAVVAAVMTLARKAATRSVSILAGGAMAVLLVVAASARLNLESTPAAASDLRVVAEGIDFAPTALQARAGDIAIHVENRDLVHHDLTFETLGVKLDVPASASRRIELTAEPGTYEGICSIAGHERMTVTLVVE
jgi:plastocyanin